MQKTENAKKAQSPTAFDKPVKNYDISVYEYSTECYGHSGKINKKG
jgi:hypothetical protein